MSNNLKVNFREAFRDIVFGFSQFQYTDTDVFIKHLSVFDQIDTETLDENFYKKAQSLGLPTEKESLDYISENDIWTLEDTSDLEQKRLYLESLKTTRSNIYLLSQINKLDEDIEKAEQEYSEALYKKEELIGFTCEKYAQKRVTEHYIITSFYKDKELTCPFFSIEEIDELDVNEMSFIINQYNEKYRMFDDDNIQKIVLQDFFQMYFPFCDNVSNFYDKPLFRLSINQVKLIVYSKMFKNIFECYPKIPDAIKKDPQKIFDFVNSQDKAKSTLKNMDKEGASTIIGAKKEDYDHLGIQQGKSLSSILQEKGGKMNMKDIMAAMNV